MKITLSFSKVPPLYVPFESQLKIVINLFFISLTPPTLNQYQGVISILLRLLSLIVFYIVFDLDIKSYYTTYFLKVKIF